MVSGKLQTGLDMCRLKQRDLSSTAGFQSLTMLCVSTVNSNFCYWVPKLSSGYWPVSPYLDPRCLLIVLEIIYAPRGGILHGAQGEIVSDLVFCFFFFFSELLLPAFYLFSPKCLLILDWLTLVLCICIVLSTMSLAISSVLAVVKRLQFDSLRVWTGVFNTDNEFKQVPFIQVTSVSRRSCLYALNTLYHYPNLLFYILSVTV